MVYLFLADYVKNIPLKYVSYKMNPLQINICGVPCSQDESLAPDSFTLVTT
jgi:hypothetical protein